MNGCLKIALGCAALVSCDVFSANKGNWKTDCVGHLEISLPGEADVAATSFRQMFETRRTLYSEFEDGQPALYSKYQYAGVMEVSRRLSIEENQRYLGDIRKTRAQFKEDADRYRKMNADAPEGDYEEFKPKAGDGLGMRRFKYLYAAKSIDSHAFSWQLTAPEERISEFVPFMNKLVNEVESRQNFTMPARAGLCVPHLFIPTEGRERYGHSIATTYRLKDHPDVTILLEDTSARRPDASQDPSRFTAVYKSNFFWTQDYRSYDSIKNLLTVRRHNSIAFAGQKGIESMVSMVRKDKVTEDYGYLVVTQGDPDAAADTPDLLLYVIRDAKNAEKRGIPPIGKDEFFKLAKDIAASVRHRSVRE